MVDSTYALPELGWRRDRLNLRSRVEKVEVVLGSHAERGTAWLFFFSNLKKPVVTGLVGSSFRGIAPERTLFHRSAQAPEISASRRSQRRRSP